MPRQRNGNEVTVHTVRLAPHSSEFQSVVQQFQKTAGAVTITSIERIQNPLLYQAYQLRKQKMDKDNGGNNERQLFHGTASRNVKKINSQGFNRNFSGVAHGRQRLIKALFSALGVPFFKRSASWGRSAKNSGEKNVPFRAAPHLTERSEEAKLSKSFSNLVQLLNVGKIFIGVNLHFSILTFY